MTEETDRSDCWTVLEIAPTDDLKLIRRAYASKLKSIDIDRDPRAFIALRAAYDEARYGDPRPTEPDLAESESWSPATDSAAGTEMTAILSLLHGSSSPAAIAAPLADLTQRLIERSRSSSLAELEAIEDWLAETIAHGVPRTNGMHAVPRRSDTSSVATKTLRSCASCSGSIRPTSSPGRR